jgi:uncharacterized protein
VASTFGNIGAFNHARRYFVQRSASTSALAIALGVSQGCAFNRSPFVQYQPLLYEIRPNESSRSSEGSAYLFGAIHLGLGRFYPLPDFVEQAWRRSDCLAVELDIAARFESLREAFSKRVLLAEGESLDDLLDPAEIQKIKNLMRFDHQDWSRLRRLQPWALSLNLFNRIEAIAGPRASLGIDMFFLRRAKAQTVKIAELEDPQDQVEAFAGGSRAEQLEQLRARLQQVANYQRGTELIINAWRQGDAAALAELKREAFGDTQRLSSLHQRMNVARDRKMARAMNDLIQQGRKIFAVVGAFHLVGPDSLIEVLRRDHQMDVSLVTA